MVERTGGGCRWWRLRPGPLRGQTRCDRLCSVSGGPGCRSVLVCSLLVLGCSLLVLVCSLLVLVCSLLVPGGAGGTGGKGGNGSPTDDDCDPPLTGWGGTQHKATWRGKEPPPVITVHGGKPTEEGGGGGGGVHIDTAPTSTLRTNAPSFTHSASHTAAPGAHAEL